MKGNEASQSSGIVRRSGGPVAGGGQELLAGRLEPAGGRSTSKGRSLLAPLWQAKWTVLLVAVLVAAPAIAATWLLVVPEYRARAEVRVRPIMPRLVFRTENSGLIPLYQSFMNTQVSIIRNPTVLQRVLEQPDVQATSWYRHLRADGQARSWYRRPRALLRRIAPPSPGADIERLQKALEVRARPRTEVIDISFTAENPADASIVTNAVLDQYVRYISDATDKTEKVILEQLTEEYNRLKGQIGSDEQTLADLREQLGTATPDELISQKHGRGQQEGDGQETHRGARVPGEGTCRPGAARRRGQDRSARQRRRGRRETWAGRS